MMPLVILLNLKVKVSSLSTTLSSKHSLLKLGMGLVTLRSASIRLFLLVSRGAGWMISPKAAAAASISPPPANQCFLKRRSIVSLHVLMLWLTVYQWLIQNIIFVFLPPRLSTLINMKPLPFSNLTALLPVVYKIKQHVKMWLSSTELASLKLTTGWCATFYCPQLYCPMHLASKWVSGERAEEDRGQF